MNEDAALGIFLIFSILIGLAISVFLAFSLWDTVSRIPKEYRAIEPYFAWLTLIPIVGFIFFWILVPFKIPESLRNYFAVNDANDIEKSDFGKRYGLGVTISFTLMFVPLINALAWIPALVFLILYILTLNEFKKHLPTREQLLIDAPDQSISPKSSRYTKTPNTEVRYENLVKLKQLLDDGILTQDEFEKEKQKLLEN